MKTRTKLSLGFGGQILFTAVLGISVLFGMADVKRQFSFVVEHDATVIANARHLSKLVVDMETGQRGFCITQKEEFLVPYISGAKEFDTLIEKEKKLVSDNPGQVNVLERIEHLIQEWQEKAAEPEIAARREMNEHSESLKVVAALLETGTGKALMDEIRWEFDRFIKVEEELATRRYSNASETALKTKTITVTLLFLALCLGVAVTVAINRAISIPLAELAQGAERVGSGDLDTRVEVGSSDEIGDLSRSFNNMTRNLREISSSHKHAEEQIKKDLKEKEVLLKEIHHRVKNNLQIVGSLLGLQAKHIKDKQALEMFEESRNRVRSMALVHENLYRSKDFANIDFAKYIKNLTDQLVKTYIIDSGKIELDVKVEDVCPGIDQAIPCGLIINELVSNALKHAFPPSLKRKGKIEIAVHSMEADEIELTVKDNGVGIPKELDIRKTESLGLKLVTILAEDQLDGKVTLERSGGTKFTIRFKQKNS